MTETTAIQRRYLHLRGAADTASIRTAQFMGREHVVVPVVALIGGAVVRPMGSKGPEYVPAEELSLVPGSWNGRPVVADHPTRDGMPLSASESPEMLASVAFGTVFNARYDGGRLKMDAFIDASRAQEMGGDALSALTRSQAGQSVEVSVGAWVYADIESGVSPSGAPYEYVWREIVPDHLAMLPEGDIGACSVEMGCGAPRIAKEAAVPAKRKKTRELRAAKVKFSASITDREMRDWLESELANAEPDAKWIWVTDVDQDDGFVVYEVSTEENPERTYKRSFSVDGEKLALAGDKEEVRQQVTYVPASSGSSEIVYTTTDDGETPSEPMTTASTCSCNRPKEAATMAEDTMSAVDKLIAAADSPFTDESRKALDALGAAELKSMCSRYLSEDAEPEEPAEPVAAKPEPAAEPEKAAPAAEPETKAASLPDWVQGMTPEQLEDMRAAGAAHKAAMKQRKDALVATLKGAQDTYTEAELQAKPVPELEKLSRLCKVDTPPQPVDFSGRGLARPAAGDSDIYLNPPDPWALAIAKRDGADQAGGTH